VSESSIFEPSGVENGGVGKKMVILVLMSILTDVLQFYQFWSFLTNCIALGPNFGPPNHFRCLKVLYSSSAGLKMGV
jgi:hypothetical protein